MECRNKIKHNVEREKQRKKKKQRTIEINTGSNERKMTEENKIRE
jgi:hypothetical protein